MKKVFLIVIGFLFSVSGLSAQERLQPATSVYDVWGVDYAWALRTNLLERDNEHFYIRYLVTPSFHKEYMFGVKLIDSAYYAVYRTPRDRSVWSSWDFSSYKHPGKLTIEIEEIQCPLSNEQGAMLIDLFESAVLSARFVRTNNIGHDGTSYLFSVWTCGYLTAATWSPHNGDYADELVKAVEEIVQLVKSAPKKLKLKPDLEDRIRWLTRKYPLEPQTEEYDGFEIDSIGVKHPYLTREYGEELFRNHFRRVVSQFEHPATFHQDSLLSFERGLTFYDISRDAARNMSKGIYPNKKKYRFDNAYSCRRFEVPYCDGDVMIFSRLKDDKVKVVLYDWHEVRNIQFDHSETYSAAESRDVFRTKRLFLIDEITRILGPSYLVIEAEHDDGVEMKWENKEGVKAILTYYPNNQIFLSVYNE